MALIIAGERSGVGKTTITLMILAALRRGEARLPWSDAVPREAGVAEAIVQSFKVGPDYIDPMFHSYVTSRPCYNLDPVLTSEAAVQRCFATHQQAHYALVEGVMGLFDGTVWTAPGPKPWGDNTTFAQHQTSAFASTAHIAKLLDLPVLLVIDCSRLSGSVAAIAQGYAQLDPAVQIAGLILNRVGSDRHLTLLKSALIPLGIPIVGVLRRHKEIELPDRHLGLVPTDELPELEQRLDRLAEIGTEVFDWAQLLPMLKAGAEETRVTSPSPPSEQGRDLRQAVAELERRVLPPQREGRVRIGVARDRAFNFYYAENLECLEKAGAELVYWSPLDDEALPHHLQGLLLGGGFPEVFATALAANQSAMASVRQAIQAGLTTYAECGGLMYLCQALRTSDGQTSPMVGVLPATAVMGRLTLGYRRAIAQCKSPLLKAGAEIWGHEFHHSKLEWNPQGQDDAERTTALFKLWGNDLTEAQPEGIGLLNGPENLHASYVHLHWGAQNQLVERFLTQCQRFKPL